MLTAKWDPCQDIVVDRLVTVVDFFRALSEIAIRAGIIKGLPEYINMLRDNTLIGFPRLWTVIGYILVADVAIFTGRIVYEETILTWKNGPQMVGFAMAHIMPPLLLTGLIGVIGGLLWLIFSVTLLFRRRFRLPWFDLLPILLLLLAGVTLSIPYETWEELMVRTLGRSMYGGEFLVQAAGEDKQSFVAFLLRQGCDINDRSRDGSTPLSAASVEGHLKMVEFLISKGAEINRKDGLSGESALMAAAEMGQLEVVKVLLSDGAEACALDKDGRHCGRSCQKVPSQRYRGLHFIQVSLPREYLSLSCIVQTFQHALIETSWSWEAEFSVLGTIPAMGAPGTLHLPGVHLLALL